MATLRGSACRCQIFSVPQYGDAGVFASSTGAFDGSLISLVAFVRGSSTARMSELWYGPYTNPFALYVGLRSSVAAASLRRLVGSPQSHIEITRLRSTPTGRGGASGYAPAAIRSVQSANALRCSPKFLKTALMFPPFGPIAT